MVWRKNGEQLVVLYGCAAAAAFLAAAVAVAVAAAFLAAVAAAAFLAAGTAADTAFPAAAAAAAAAAFLDVTERNSEAASEQLLDLLRRAHQGLSILKFYL